MVVIGSVPVEPDADDESDGQSVGDPEMIGRHDTLLPEDAPKVKSRKK